MSATSPSITRRRSMAGARAAGSSCSAKASVQARRSTRIGAIERSTARFWKTLFTKAEGDMMRRGWRPLSRHPHRKSLEGALLDGWTRGENPSIAQALRRLTAPAPL